MSDGKMLTCAACGNEEPEGTRFCRSCGAAFVAPAAEPSRAEPPPPPLPSPEGKGRRRWVVVGAVAALLVAGGAAAAVLSFTGGDGPTQATPPGGEITTPADASGTDCAQLASFVEDFAPALATAEADLAASPETVEEITAALAALASQAPEDVRQDFETVSETWVEMARAVSDLGLEPGDIPTEEQVDEILALSGTVFDDPEFLDASLSVADWMETAVAECDSSLTGTETTENGDTAFGGETTDAVGGEGVDATCEGFVAFATLTRKENPDPSVDDVEDLAAIASELASKAPAETSDAGIAHVGEPNKSLEAIAQGLESYARLLSELGLEPGSDALDEPRIAEVVESIQDADADLTGWFEDRCSPEDLAAFEKIRNG